MSGKGDTAGIEQEPAAGGSPREAEPGLSDSGSGRWIARSGRDAVNAMERRLCGDGAVHSAAMVQGLALAGRRAARLLDRSTVPPTTGPEPSADAAWVEHRLLSQSRRAAGTRPFELVAAGAQQAVDHCLVAHRIAERTGLPVTCGLDEELARALALVRLPEPGKARSSLDASMPLAATAPTPEIADEAFERVSVAVGRRLEALHNHRTEDARVVLLAAGAAGARAIRLADALRDAGLLCGAVIPALMRPFPMDRLVDSLRSKDTVVVVESVGSRLGPADLTDELRAALGPDSPVRLHSIRPDSEGANWWEGASTALGVAPPSEASPGSEQSYVLGVAPGGRWSDEFLLDAVTRLADLGPLHLERPDTAARGIAALAVGRGLPRSVSRGLPCSAGPAQVDRLLVSHGTALDRETVRALRTRGVLLLFGHGTPGEVWSMFSRVVRSELREREIRLRWIELSAMETHELDAPDALRTLLQGAVLGGVGLAQHLGVDSERVAMKGRDPHTIRLLDAGARAVRDLDPVQLDEEAGLLEQNFRGTDRTPRLPSPSVDEVDKKDESWRDRLRGFHLTGRGAHSAMEPLPALALSPLAAVRLEESDADWRHYPLILPDADPSVEQSPHATLLARVRETLEALGQQGESPTMLNEHPGRFVSTAGGVLRDIAMPLPMGDLVERTCERVSREFDLSPAGAERLNREIDLLGRTLPRAGLAVGLGRDTLATLYSTAVHRARAPRRKAFRAEIDSLALALEDLLRLDDQLGPDGSAPEKLSASFGGPAEQLIDPDVLSRQLQGRRGSKPLAPARRARIEQTLAILRDYLDRAPAEPETVVVHSGPIPAEWESAPVRLVEHPDGLEAALGLVAGLAQGRVEVFRAVRIARLEARSAYDESRHGPVLERLNWEALTNDEYLLLPPVLVLESGTRLRGRGIHSLSKLLRSGLPVHVLVTDRVLELDLDDASWEETTGYHPGLGYVAVAHREAFVLQSTLAEPAHLLEGLTRMAASLRPSVALVATPAWSSPVPPWRQLIAARDGRATPCFRYDPDAGTSWADRFDLAGNPEMERTWPEAEATYVDAEQSPKTWTLPFTFAHAAALDPGYRAHFRVIPPQAWSDEQIEVERYLEAEDSARALPFLWVLRDDGELARAVTTRDMAFACRDRMRAWHILQELAGTNNEYARRAAEAARAETLDEARKSREELEAAHSDELARVRGEAAGEAMERLVGVLMDVESLPAVERAPAAPPAAPAPLEVTEQPPAGEAPAEEAISFEEAFIDSALCTTCQECININARMFKYDGNKQAFLADAAAGTFQQLVMAAEKCPARCIHPGVPRDGDESATDDLIARAAKFN